MVLIGPGCKLPRRKPVKARMRPLGIVVKRPRLDHLPGMSVAGEQVLVQAFIPQSAVEALDKPVLHRLAGRDVIPPAVIIDLHGPSLACRWT